jgi:hypothetical protein
MVIDYGLECRISLTNFRMFFIENSRDFLYRKGTFQQLPSQKKSRTPQQKQARLEKIVSKLKASAETEKSTEQV